MLTTHKDTEDRNARQTVIDLKEDMEETAQKAGQKVRELYDTATQETRDTTAAIEKQIRRHPIAAGAIAGGIGVLLGLLFRRR